MSREAKSRRSRSPLRSIVRMLSGLFAIAVALVVVALLSGTIGIFSPMRTFLAERFLSTALGTPVEIEGPVEYTIGSNVVLSGSKISVDRPDGAASGDSDRIEEGTIGLGLRSLLRGQFDLTSLQLNNVELAENSRLVGFDPTVAGSPNVHRWFGLVPATVRLASHADIAVYDITYRYIDSTTGWEFDVAVASAVSGRDTTGETKLAVSGTVNGTAVKIDGTIQPADDDDDSDDFTVTVAASGAAFVARSLVSETNDNASQVVDLSADIDSIGNVLDALRIARSIEGTAKLAASIDSAGDVSAVRDLAARIGIQDGPAFQLSGTVADLDSRSGIDISVESNWPGGAGAINEDGLLAFEVREITGRLTGDLDSLALTDGWITTNLFSDAIPSLGPISAGAIRRVDNRLAVDDIRVLAGPEDSPTFDLSGQIGDLLQLADFRLAGKIAMPIADMIATTPPDPTALGRLAGDFAVSDTSGTAGVDTLTAAVAGSSVFSASLRLVADQTQPTETASFSLDLDVPDYARLATALGVGAKPAGHIDFSGNVTLSPANGDIAGHLRVGKTAIAGNLAVKAPDQRPLISGKVSTQELHLADARNLANVAIELRELWGRRTGASATIPDKHAAAQSAIIRPHFDFEVSAGKIDGAGTAVSGVSGRVLYDRGMLNAKSMALRFDGGHFAFDATVHTGEPHLPFSTKGRFEAWPISNVLAALAIDLPIEGLLGGAYDLSSSAVSMHAAASEAKGNLYMRIVDGSIGNRLIDLSGLVLPSWLFAPSAKTGHSRIECFSAKVGFDPGLAVLQSAVVETDDVLVKATGRIDFRNDTIDIEASPKARNPNLIPIVTPFAIRGKLSSPKVVLKGGGVVGRGIAETLALPFNTLGTLLGVDKTGPKPRSQSDAC